MKLPARLHLLSWLALAALAALACSLPFPLPLPGGGKASATPVLAPGELVFTAPYTSYLHKGEGLPGSSGQSGVQYVDATDNGWQVLIDGQSAVKKVGDSLNWKGQVAPGVVLDYKLRVLGVFFDQFEAVGTVDIHVQEPSPAAAQLPESADLHFDKLVLLNTATKAGQNLAGTTITFVGKTDKGAQLSGVDGYAYREVGDSIDWSGQARSDVWIKLALRVTDISDKELKVTGTGEIWIAAGR